MEAVKLIEFPIQIEGPLLLATGAAGTTLIVTVVVPAALIQLPTVAVTE
jgi:hypothetical protein